MSLQFYGFPLRFLQNRFDDNDLFSDISNFAIYQEWEKTHKNETDEDFNEFDYWDFAANECGLLFCGLNQSTEMTDDDVFFVNDCWERGKRDFENTRAGEVFLSISIDTYFSFCEKSKTDYEKLLLFGFLAAKSLIGHKDFTKTYFEILFSRMAGYKTKTDKNLWAKQIQDIAGKEYRRNKFLSDLEDFWHVYSHSEMGMRGFLISVKLDYEKLYFAYLNTKSKDKRKDEKAKIREKVLKELASQKRHDL